MLLQSGETWQPKGLGRFRFYKAAIKLTTMQKIPAQEQFFASEATVTWDCQCGLPSLQQRRKYILTRKEEPVRLRSTPLITPILETYVQKIAETAQPHTAFRPFKKS